MGIYNVLLFCMCYGYSMEVIVRKFLFFCGLWFGGVNGKYNIKYIRSIGDNVN